VRSQFEIEEEAYGCKFDHKKHLKGHGGDSVYHHTSMKKHHEAVAKKMMGTSNVELFSTVQVNDKRKTARLLSRGTTNASMRIGSATIDTGGMNVRPFSVSGNAKD
jgi:hypothetical protein